MIWGLTRSGRYDVKSGYKLIEALLDLQNSNYTPQPPLERQLWSNLWKTKAPPKLKHFLWRVNAGALAVKAQLRTRGIRLDPTCSVCGQGSETICHVMFHCTTAKEVWKMSNTPPPPAGWSQNSVFLNLHHLLKCSRNSNIGSCSRQAFPWVLWQLWKARNAFCYESVTLSPSVIYGKAMEEAAVWLNLHGALPKSESCESFGEAAVKWQKPPSGFVKCNVGSSWEERSKTGGGAWIVRDQRGVVLFHSRRSFSMVYSSSQAHLEALQWAAEAMCDLKLKKVIMEFSSIEVKKALDHPLLCLGATQSCSRAFSAIYSIVEGKIHAVPNSCNFVANLIAGSVTRDQRHQSYVARNGPPWLTSQILMEASA